MKNTTIFISGWFFVKAMVFLFINTAFVGFTEFFKKIEFGEYAFFITFLVFAILKFILRNNFTLSLRFQKSEIFFLLIAGMNSKNQMLLALSCLSIIEYFHFIEQFCKSSPSEKWDGNELAEETED
jgi:hypothetical protein